MLVQYFVIILFCWSSSVHTDEECQNVTGSYILTKSPPKSNDFKITFCNGIDLYEAVVKSSVQLCSCNNGSEKTKCLGADEKWYHPNQVMSTIGDELDDCSLVQYCSVIANSCCLNCSNGCTVNMLTQEMAKRFNSLLDFFGEFGDDMDFY